MKKLFSRKRGPGACGSGDVSLGLPIEATRFSPNTLGVWRNGRTADGTVYDGTVEEYDRSRAEARIG